MVIMDFAKAFDQVNHSLLCHKLDHYGIQDSSNQWISGFLWDRRQTVVVDGATSDFIKVKLEVTEGPVLGPCLFIVFINNLADRVASIIRLFADDTTVYRLVASGTDQQRLQEDLHKLERWESEWDMDFHSDKRSILFITRS